MSEKKTDPNRKRNGSPPPRREGGSPSGGSGSGPGSKFTRGAFGWLLLLAMALVLYMLIVKKPPPRDIDLAEFNRLLYARAVQSITIEGHTIRGKIKPNFNVSTGTFDRADPAAADKSDKTGAGSSMAGSSAGSSTGTATGERSDRTLRDPRDNREFQAKLHPAYITPEVLDKWAALVSEPGPAGADGTAKGGEVRYDDSSNFLYTVVLPFLPWMILLALVWFFLIRQLRAGSGGGLMNSFTRTRAKWVTKEHTNTTFDDVAGIDEAKDEVREIIEFLKNPKRFARLGGRIPRGVLLVGEPGCGKTLLAKAIAGEADVPFLSICGSDFVEMFVGVGASRVRDLFRQAKESAPCIIFLDEIDAVGRRRGSGFQSGGHDEREQTLNAILVEMDGFETSDQVIVIAATNRADVLDPALKRPGRFDRQIVIPLPDLKGRLEILNVHARNVKLAANVDMQRLARGTTGFSGAELAALINEAALSATMSDKEAIEHPDLEEARDKLRMGRARRSRVIEEPERRQTAIHEAGHALLAHLLPDATPLHKVTIIPRGNTGGMTMAIPEKDILTFGRKRALAQIKMALGGRIAEELFGIDNDSGVAGDIRQATSVARAMVCEWGMSEKLGFVHYTRDGGEGSGLESYIREYSEATAQAIDAEVRRIIDTAYAEAKTVLDRHRSDLEKLADALLKYETLDRTDVVRILAGESLDFKLLSKEDKRPEPPTVPAKASVEEPTESHDVDVPAVPQPGT